MHESIQSNTHQVSTTKNGGAKLGFYHSSSSFSVVSE